MRNLRSNQEGMVSIVISLIIMIILSLITIGFAKIMQREQRQALDRQLSSQAYYAAESGVNDAIQGLRAGVLAANKTACDVTAAPAKNGGVIDATAGVAYTCMLVNQTPPTLVFDNITAERSKLVHVKGENNIDSIKIAWNDAGPPTSLFNNNCNTNPVSLPPAWAPTASPAMLRVDLIPMAAASSRSNLINSALNMYLFPTQSAGSTCGPVNAVTYATQAGVANQGQVIVVGCDAALARQCSLSINGLAPAIDFMLRIRGIYHGANVEISATGGGSPVNLVGEQAIVDVTGRANDVLRRIQVRAPLNATGFDYPEFALQTGDSICKMLGVAPASAAPPTPALGLNLEPAPAAPDTPDPSCALN